ncbi:MAG: hypothetical protein ABW032_11255 [Burkholderiaceae bacterium]
MGISSCHIDVCEAATDMPNPRMAGPGCPETAVLAKTVLAKSLTPPPMRAKWRSAAWTGALLAPGRRFVVENGWVFSNWHACAQAQIPFQSSYRLTTDGERAWAK